MSVQHIGMTKEDINDEKLEELLFTPFNKLYNSIVQVETNRIKCET